MSSILSIASILTLLGTCLAQAAPEVFFAQGLLAGEVTSTSAIVQTRLTATPTAVDGKVPGTEWNGRFEIADNPEFKDARETPWLNTTAAGDFILKTAIDGLKPATTYYYRLRVFDHPTADFSPIASFKTLPAVDQAAAVDFVLTSCPNYAFFHHGTKGVPAYQGSDRHLGYPALAAIQRLKPDFVILNGDCVYYDHPWDTRAQTLPELRQKWHEQFVQPRYVQLFANTPTYWLKDDHDHRRNDSDATGDYEPSHALGVQTFREQVPVVNPADPAAVTYRTHRVGRDLQLWFLEGRDYRSPNSAPDGPEKSLWGASQKAWLQRTLKESDATFKLLISPTPLIGPDDAYKKDNHVNAAGFRYEGEAFFAWLKDAGIPPDRFFILCGDRHWKYHSRHPAGWQEFSSGALNVENARLGRKPGTRGSSDPEGSITQPYTDAKPSGGFLRVQLQPANGDQPAALRISLHDDSGAQLAQSPATP